MDALDRVEVRSVGGVLVFSSHDGFALREVVRQIEREGGNVLRRPVKVGDDWLASVAKPENADDLGTPTA